MDQRRAAVAGSVPFWKSSLNQNQNSSIVPQTGKRVSHSIQKDSNITKNIIIKHIQYN